MFVKSKSHLFLEAMVILKLSRETTMMMMMIMMISIEKIGNMIVSLKEISTMMLQT